MASLTALAEFAAFSQPRPATPVTEITKPATPVAEFTKEWPPEYAGAVLGIDAESERTLFNAVASSLRRGLPEGWSQEIDDEFRGYFFNHLTGESSWHHPDHDVFVSVVELYRRAWQQPDTQELFQQALSDSQAGLLAASERWWGPYYAEDGTPYWYDTELNVSAWQDHRADVSRRHLLLVEIVSTLSRAAVATARERPQRSLPPASSQPAFEPVAEPVAEPVVQQAAPPAAQPAAQPVTDPATEPVASPVWKAASDSPTMDQVDLMRQEMAQLKEEMRGLVSTVSEGFARTPAQTQSASFWAVPGQQQVACHEDGIPRPQHEHDELQAANSEVAMSPCSTEGACTHQSDDACDETKRSGPGVTSCDEAWRIEDAWLRSRCTDTTAAENASVAQRVSQLCAKRTGAATSIQAAWRGHLARGLRRMMARERRRKRKQDKLQALRKKSAIDVQRLWRGARGRSRCRVLEIERRARRRMAEADAQRQQAARLIQARWRFCHHRRRRAVRETAATAGIETPPGPCGAAIARAASELPEPSLPSEQGGAWPERSAEAALDVLVLPPQQPRAEQTSLSRASKPTGFDDELAQRSEDHWWQWDRTVRREADPVFDASPTKGAKRGARRKLPALPPDLQTSPLRGVAAPLGEMAFVSPAARKSGRDLFLESYKGAGSPALHELDTLGACLRRPSVGQPPSVLDIDLSGTASPSARPPPPRIRRTPLRGAGMQVSMSSPVLVQGSSPPRTPPF